MAAVTIYSNFGAPKDKSFIVSSVSPSICHWNDGTGCHDLKFFECWVLSQFFTLFFDLHQEALQFFLAFCHKSGIICISEVIDISHRNLASGLYFFHPAWHFTWMYSAYKLNKQGNNIQPWCTPFPNWNQSIVPCVALTVASWPAYRYLRRQVRWSGIPISLRVFHCLLWFT